MITPTSKPSPSRIHQRRGLTLLELVMVLAILTAIATLVVPNVSSFLENSRSGATKESMNRLQDQIMNRYAPDMTGVVPLYPTFSPYSTLVFPGPNANVTYSPIRTVTNPQLHFLFANPNFVSFSTISTYDQTARRGWNGPYLLSGSGGQYPDPTDTLTTAKGFTNVYGNLGDLTLLDGWGNPIIIRLETVTYASGTWTGPCLVSAGPDGGLDVNSVTIGGQAYSFSNTDNLIYPLR